MSDEPVIYNSRVKLTTVQGFPGGCVEVNGHPAIEGDEIVTTNEATFFDDGEVKEHRVVGSTLNPAPQPGVTGPSVEGDDSAAHD